MDGRRGSRRLAASTRVWLVHGRATSVECPAGRNGDPVSGCRSCTPGAATRARRAPPRMPRAPWHGTRGWRVVRDCRLVPGSCSSWRMATLSGGWAMCSPSPAPRRFSSSATATMKRRWRSSATQTVVTPRSTRYVQGLERNPMRVGSAAARVHAGCDESRDHRGGEPWKGQQRRRRQCGRDRGRGDWRSAARGGRGHRGVGGDRLWRRCAASRPAACGPGLVSSRWCSLRRSRSTS